MSYSVFVPKAIQKQLDKLPADVREKSAKLNYLFHFKTIFRLEYSSPCFYSTQRFALLTSVHFSRIKGTITVSVLVLLQILFFIHGVATRDVNYSKKIQHLLREGFLAKDKQLPHFYGSFWGAVVSDKNKIWNHVHQDLKELKKN